MCDVLSGVPCSVTKCDGGERGVKIGQKSVTYFMDGPFTAGLYALGAACNLRYFVFH